MISSFAPARCFEFLSHSLPLHRVVSLPPNMDKSVGYNVDPSDELNDEVVLGEKTGTLADKKAMARLGKEQIFKVWFYDSIEKAKGLTLSLFPAKFRVCLHLWFRSDRHEHLGDNVINGCIRTRKWRTRRSYLDLSCHMDRIHFG